MRCMKRAAHPPWVFRPQVASGSRAPTRHGEWRKGRGVILGSKAPGCDWDKSLVMERVSKAALYGCAAAPWAPLAAGERAGGWLQPLAPVR